MDTRKRLPKPPSPKVILKPEPFFTHDTAPSRLVLTQLDRPIRELSTEPPDWVLVRESGNAVLFRTAPLGGQEGGN